MKKAPFILLKITLFLLTALIFFGHNNHIHAEEIPLRQKLISIDLNDQDFTQAMEAIAGQAGVKIDIHGNNPVGSRSLKFEAVPIDQVITEVANTYGILNHAVAFNSETKKLTIVILKSASAELDLPFPGDQHIEFWEKPLTSEQMRQLDDYDDIGSPFPLTADQMRQLDFDDGLSRKSLTQEQMEQLEFEHQDQSLTVEQMSQLEPDDGLSNKTLTPEQMRQLE